MALKPGTSMRVTDRSLPDISVHATWHECAALRGVPMRYRKVLNRNLFLFALFATNSRALTQRAERQSSTTDAAGDRGN